MLTDSRWDMTYLGMQVLIEGLALAAFASIRDHAKNPLAAAVNAYVMQDEARHVAFGRLALRDYYPQLTDAERDEREEFAVEALLPHARPLPLGGVGTLGLPVDELHELHYNSEQMKPFRSRLFSRIVPTIKDIGLWGERVQKAYADMGVMDYADIDVPSSSPTTARSPTTSTRRCSSRRRSRRNDGPWPSSRAFARDLWPQKGPSLRSG